MAGEFSKYKEQLYQIITEIQDFEFEDRKLVLHIITELFNSCTNLVQEALYVKRFEIVDNLIEKYNISGMATFAGPLLRLFTRTSVNSKMNNITRN